jgi:hypothetical protein
MPFGAVVALIVLAGFAVWGIFILRSNAKERSTEASSHSESQSGFNGY